VSRALIAYVAYGLALLGLAGAADSRGWTLAPVTQVRAVPRSIRENPASYRPVYRGGGRTRSFGGK
jgi:hypothetical protein